MILTQEKTKSRKKKRTAARTAKRNPLGAKHKDLLESSTAAAKLLSYSRVHVHSFPSVPIVSCLLELCTHCVCCESVTTTCDSAWL